MTEQLAQVSAPHFVAGIVFRYGKVAKVAPILQRHIKIGWVPRQVWLYCVNRHWHVEMVRQ